MRLEDRFEGGTIIERKMIGKISQSGSKDSILNHFDIGQNVQKLILVNINFTPKFKAISFRFNWLELNFTDHLKKY